MSHIGRIAAGTLAKRGRRGGSSVSRVFVSLYLSTVVIVGPSKSMEVCTSEAVGRAQNSCACGSWRGFEEEKRQPDDRKKGEEKRERVT